MKRMTFVSLFAGVGGFDLGFEQAGMDCIGQVEIDAKCREVLEAHWPDIPRHDDVTTAIDWANEHELVGRTDIVCGGFPCQDVSVAGKRAGLAGERTGLFWDALAFATHVEARWIVLENVPGLLTSNQGRDLGTIFLALADAGYVHLEWRVLDSQFFGVPQRRRRVFLVGCTRVPRRRPVLAEPEGGGGNIATLPTARQDVAGTLGGGSGNRGWACDTDRMTFVPYVKSRRAQSDQDYETWVDGKVTPTLNAFDNATESRATVVMPTLSASNNPSRSPQSSEVTAQVEAMVRAQQAVRRLTPVECERLQGFPDGWTEGIADTHRYKQMGNAVTVNVAEYVGKLLVGAA